MNWTQGVDHPFIGRAVLVHWRDRRNDWHSYTVIGYFDGWIVLRGRACGMSPCRKFVVIGARDIAYSGGNRVDTRLHVKQGKPLIWRDNLTIAVLECGTRE